MLRLNLREIKNIFFENFEEWKKIQNRMRSRCIVAQLLQHIDDLFDKKASDEDLIYLIFNIFTYYLFHNNISLIQC